MSELNDPNQQQLTPSAPGDGDRLICGTSPHFWNKQNRAPYTRVCKQHTAIARHADPDAPPVYDTCWAFSRFKPESLTPYAFTGHVLSGGAWTPSLFGGNGRRTNENWIQAELIAIDYDDNVSVADCLNLPFIRQYAFLVHPSASSGKPDDDGHPIYKTRVIFRLDHPITGTYENYRLAARAICHHLGLDADPASFKPAQLYYGSTNRIEAPVINHAARLPVAVVDELIAPLLAAAERQRVETERQRAGRQYAAADRTSQPATRKIADKLDDAYRKVATTTVDRTGEAYKQAYHLAHYLTYWSITEQDIERTLLEALAANGAGQKYGDGELLRHIHNGIRAGLADPPEPCALAAIPLRVVHQAQDHPIDYAQRSTGSPYYHEAGDPRNWLIAICQAFPRKESVVKLARLLFAAYRTHRLTPEDFTMRQLLDARTALAVPVTTGTLKEAFTLVEGLFWNLNTREQDVFKNQNNPQGGRPERHYCAVPLVEIERQLPRYAEHRIEESRHLSRKTTPNLTAYMIDALDGDARQAALEVAPQLQQPDEEARRSGRWAREDFSALVRSLKDTDPVCIPLDCANVRAALFEAENDPDEAKGYREIMREYGVSIGNVKKLVERAGLRVIKQTVDCRINAAATFEQEVSAARKAKGGFPIALIERKASGEEVEHPYSLKHGESNREVIANVHQAGGTVDLRLRTKSKYARADTAQVQEDQGGRTGAGRGRRETDLDPITPYYGTGYNPSVVLRWLKTHLRRMGWKDRPDGYWINPDGVKYDLFAPAADGEDGLLAIGIANGAVITRLA